MSQNTKIEWADHTFNPWIGCTKVGPGCDNCYASAWDRRFAVSGHAMHWGPGQARSRTKTWGDPVRWNKQHEAFFAAHGRRQRVFCASLADVFDNAVDPQWLSDLFDLTRRTPNLDWLLLTKRIGNWKSRMQAVHDHLSARRPPTPKPRSVADEESDAMNWVDAWIRNDVDPIPANVWVGATIVNQEEADRDIPKLLSVPAAKRFLSMEPLLGPVNLTNVAPPTVEGKIWHGIDTLTSANRELRGCIDWVIVGGESGPGARPMHPDWARSLRDQCDAAGVAYMFKQWGEWLPGQNEMHPESWDGRRVAHHQDGSWGATETKVTSKNYVAWDSSGCIHRGCLIDKPLNFLIDAWAERVGKKAAGRLLDGREWNGVPT